MLFLLLKASIDSASTGRPSLEVSSTGNLLVGVAELLKSQIIFDINLHVCYILAEVRVQLKIQSTTLKA